ncbi:phage head completion protein [Aerococcus urinaeequi]|uniref:phage head completion protein n=1 Tax=Aerococcus urinaeequi TaxID=51665 RepID=UPI003B48FD76
MQKRLKDKKIHIVYMEDSNSPEPDSGELAAKVPNLWAYVRETNDREKYYTHGQSYDAEELIFKINWLPEETFNTSMQIYYKKNLYNITGIDRFEGGRNDVKITAEKTTTRLTKSEINMFEGLFK